jgi:hypothetical protein
MRCFIFLILAPFIACSADELKPTTRPIEWGEGQQGVILEKQIAAIEATEPAVWREFRTGADTMGAHTSETFSVACAYLIRRDPTFFLRRHLSGDSYAFHAERELTVGAARSIGRFSILFIVSGF